MQLTQVISRNTKSNVVVLSSDPKGSEFVEWQPAGDPNGGDIQVVPESIAKHPAFTKLITRGIIVLEEASDEYREAMSRQNAAFEKRLNGGNSKQTDVMDPEAQNDMLSVPCIGPNGNGTGGCGNAVPVRERTKDERPALCSTHEHLSPQYVQYEEQQGTSVVKKWSRVTLGAPEKQQA